MDYEGKWESICEKMEDYRQISEKELQLLMEIVFEYELGWRKSRGEITRPTILFGSQNYGIPDAILRKNEQNVVCVELKKFMAGLNEHNEKQLFSYMRALKLSFGILWGNSIRVFYDKPDDNQEPINVCEVRFDKNDGLGEKLVEQLVKENFSTANFETFCQQVIKTNETRRADEKQIEFLCSENGVEHIKQLLLSEYSEDVVNRLSINVCDRRKVGHSETLETRGKNQRFVPDVVDSNIPVDFGRNGRSIQDWVRNVLSTMCVKNLISEEEFKRLHNLEYCKQTFGIQFPLLCDNEDEVLFGKHARYWTSWKLKNKYYVCSQWWKQYADVYEHNLNRWIGKIVENANKHSD